MDTAFARRQMVRQQVRTWDVFDEDTLALMNRLNRHDFVPDGYADLAYADAPIPLPHGEEMMVPLIEGRVLQALDPQADERVLEIGSGSGFFAACLASLADSVLTVDLYEDMVEMARHNLAHANIENVEVRQMNALKELPEERFDVVAVTGSIAQFDERLVDALAPGGRMFVVVGEDPVMEAWLVTKDTDGWHHEVIFETTLKALVDGERENRFVF